MAHCLWFVIAFALVSTDNKLFELSMFVKFCSRFDTCHIEGTWSFTVSCLWVSAEQQGCLHSGNIIDIIKCSTLCILVNNNIAQCNYRSEYSNDSGSGKNDLLFPLFVSFHLLYFLYVYQSFACVSAIVLIGSFNYLDAKLMFISYLLLSFSYLLMK